MVEHPFPERLMELRGTYTNRRCGGVGRRTEYAENSDGILHATGGLLSLDRLNIIHQPANFVFHCGLRQRRTTGASVARLPIHEGVAPDRHFARAVTFR